MVAVRVGGRGWLRARWDDKADGVGAGHGIGGGQ